jgi:hypothetical protein
MMPIFAEAARAGLAYLPSARWHQLLCPQRATNIDQSPKGWFVDGNKVSQVILLTQCV